MNEVNLDGEVIHIHSLEIPNSDPAGAGNGAQASAQAPTEQRAGASEDKAAGDNQSEQIEAPEEQPWPESFDEALAPHLSEALRGQLRALFLEGPEPPFVSDSGWGSRQAKPEDSETEGAAKLEDDAKDDASSSRVRGGRGKRGGRGRGGGRRGNDGFERNGPKRREDPRKVVSDVSFYRSLS